MTFSKLHAGVAVLCIGIAGGAAWWLQRSPGSGGAAGGSTSLQTAVRPPSAGGGSGGPAAAGAATVEVGVVESLRLEDDAQAVGALRSRQGVMLRPEVSGRVQSLPFNEGQRVRRGQLLVQLDDALQAAQLKQALAQDSIARSNLQRSRELMAQGFVSASAVDQAQSALEVAEAQVALARAQSARMKIVAPFDGVTGIRLVNVGDYVKDGADLVGIEDNGAVWVDFRLPEKFIARLRPGQPVEVTLDAMPGRQFIGRVDALDAQLDANGRSLLVRARLPNDAKSSGGGDLRSGMFARARIVFGVRENARLVPEEALVPLGNKQYVFKLVDGPGGKLAQRIEAHVGLRLPGKAELLDGVAAGDKVVTAGQARLRGEKTPVRVVDIERPQRPASAASGAASAASAASASARMPA